MERHEHGPNRLITYGFLIGTFQLALSLVAHHRRTRGETPRLEPRDLLVYGAATHKVTHLIANDRVTEAVRAPFVDRVRRGGETEEEPKHDAVRGALGELLTCHYCLGPWIALAFHAAHSLAPQAARFVGSVFVTVTISDFLHRGYANVRANAQRASALAEQAEQAENTGRSESRAGHRPLEHGPPERAALSS